MKDKCPNCQHEKEWDGACCAREIASLRTEVGRLERALDRMELERDKARKRSVTRGGYIKLVI